eukprot:766883-Hanusia_phi.AAC.8
MSATSPLPTPVQGVSRQLCTLRKYTHQCLNWILVLANHSARKSHSRIQSAFLPFQCNCNKA